MKKMFNIIVSLVGITLGYALADLIVRTASISTEGNVVVYVIYGITMLIGGVLFYLITPIISNKVKELIDLLDDFITKQPKDSLLIGAIGIIIGIIFAFMLSFTVTTLNLPGVLQPLKILVLVILYIVGASLGYRISMRYKDDITKTFHRRKLSEDKIDKFESKDAEMISVLEKGQITSKLLDTSVLIDGRIQQIAETGFIEGDIIVPNFVLEELQTIADSADDLKRERGRRGLDIVNSLRNSTKVNFKNSDLNYEDTTEVDIKLLKYANQTGSTIITNDFNLNKLAVVQGIKVLNINDLANSVKTVVIPGEKMIVNIIKEGKEKNQGLAYLDDGTMIVVEEAKHLIGEHVQVMVSTVLQTAAGKMIFTKLIEN